MTQDGWKMVVNLPPGAAVTVTRDNAPSHSSLPERTSSRVAKRTFDATFGGSIFTPQLACADPAISAVREDLEAMWPAGDTEGSGGSDAEDTCLCLCAKEVDPSYLTTGVDEASDAEPDDYSDESDVDDAELDAETAAVQSMFMDARPGIMHKSTLSCFYSERELGVIKEAFEILTGVIGEQDLCKVEGYPWAVLEAKGEEDEEREAKKPKTEEGAAAPDTKAKTEAPPAQDVQMQDVEAPAGDSAAVSSVAPVALPQQEGQSQDPKATAQATAKTATPQSTTSQKSLASQFSPWTFASDEEKPKKTPERKLLPPTEPFADDEGDEESGSEGSWIPQDV